VSEVERTAVCRLLPSAFARLGEEGFRALSESFYALVFDDVQPLPSGVLLRQAFASVTRSEAAERQACWLIEQFGGPPLFTQLRGRGGLLSRHAPYAGVTQEGGERWLTHMVTALRRHPVLASDAELHAALRAYFCFTASYVVEGRLLCNPMNVPY
jgi:truncated hemoglobin YjbI